MYPIAIFDRRAVTMTTTASVATVRAFFTSEPIHPLNEPDALESDGTGP